MPRRQMDSAELRERLVSVALHTFATCGYAATTLDHIAAQAGVSKGAVYWHFENKQTLLLEVARAQFRSFSSYLENQAKATADKPLDIVRTLIIKTLYYYLDHPEFCGIMKLIAAPEGSELSEALEPVVKAEYRLLRELVASALETAHKAGDLSDTAITVAPAMIVALLEGIVDQWMVAPEDVPLRFLASHIAEIAVMGLKRR